MFSDSLPTGTSALTVNSMATALLGLMVPLEGDADSGVRKGFGGYPEKKYSDVVDAIIKEYKEK